MIDLVTLATGGLGGLLGLVGNVANTLLAMRQQKQQNDYQLALIPLQLNADLERAKSAVAVAVEHGAAAAFTASQTADTATGKESRWVLNLRSLVRPICLFLLFVSVVALVLSGKADETMMDYIIRNIVTNFGMALSWYFGARASDKIMQGFKTRAS
jgi:hypothetical protein